MNDQVTDQVNETEAADARAEAQGRVDTANNRIAELKAAGAEAAAAAKEAAKNYKQAVAYNKSIADDGEGKADAIAAEQGWAAEVERTKGVVEQNKADSAAAKEDLKAAKADLKAAKPTRQPRGESTRTRSTLSDDAVLSQVEGATVSKGVMSTVASAFDGVKTLAQAREEIKAALVADGKTVRSTQWHDPDAYVNGYVKGAIKAGFLSAPASA